MQRSRGVKNNKNNFLKLKSLVLLRCPTGQSALPRLPPQLPAKKLLPRASQRGLEAMDGRRLDLAVTHAETAVEAWVQRYNGPGSRGDFANCLAVDSSNNVIVSGFSGGIDSNSDYATIKYSSAGLPLWTNRYTGPGNGSDGATAVVVDA